MPKYWGKQIFRHGSFPEVGQKQKTEREKRGQHSSNLQQGRILQFQCHWAGSSKRF